VFVAMGNPTSYGLSLDQGSTFRTQITWTNPDGTPINLTGYRVLFQLRPTADTVLAAFTFDSAHLTTGQHIQSLDATGVINVTLDDEVTATLVAGVYAYDLLVESASGVRDKILYGTAQVRSTVTRVTP